VIFGGLKEYDDKADIFVSSNCYGLMNGKGYNKGDTNLGNTYDPQINYK